VKAKNVPKDQQPLNMMSKPASIREKAVKNVKDLVASE
jgi:hypothetical protein